MISASLLNETYSIVIVKREREREREPCVTDVEEEEAQYSFVGDDVEDVSC